VRRILENAATPHAGICLDTAMWRANGEAGRTPTSKVTGHNREYKAKTCCFVCRSSVVALHRSVTQGQTVSGIVVNFGWALTPQPNIIPFDGSTIGVSVDGAFVGRPVYNNARSDIQLLFPGYQNTDGAVGHFTLDTTRLTNGVYTIAWGVSDQAGNAQGIGSRYFTVNNP
jgi:hypothetical protein